MINEGIELLEKRFSTTVGSTLALPRSTAGEDDMSPIEMFYASTTVSCSTTQEDATAFLVNKSKTYNNDRKRQEEKMDKEKQERKDAAHRDDLKSWIDQTLPENETQPLSRYLHRHIRERATVDRMKASADVAEASSMDKPYYISYSFLVDGIYPVVDGMYKRNCILELRRAYFKKIKEKSEVKWTAGDANKSITGTVFGPAVASSTYEDNLQRLFLKPPFDIRETQKLNPRGVLLAYMAMFAPDHDPLVDIAGSNPTTLRGLFLNVLDGTLYRGMTVGSLKEPFEVSDLYEGQDIKSFCDRLLLCSYQSVFLTFLGVKAWRADRYPKDRFVINAKKFVTIKLPYKEAILDKDGTWTFNSKEQKTICFTDHFHTLLMHQ